MTVKCKLCGELIVLNSDSAFTREERIDPGQQMRAHMRGHAPADVYQLMRHAGYLIDRIAFFPIDDSHAKAWRDDSIAILDWTCSNEPPV